MELSVARVGFAGPGAGHRVLVDRLWPRGVRRDGAPWEEWLREAAPSDALRRWYGHDPARFADFRARYRAELVARAADPALGRLLALASAGPVILLTASRDVEHSQAPVLAEFLRERAGEP